MTNLWWTLPLLTVSMCFLASGATAFNSIEGVSDLAKSLYRYQVATLLLFLLQLRELVRHKEECKKLWMQYTKEVITGGMCFALTLLLFLGSLHYTSISHCLLLSSTDPLFMLAYSYYKGHRVSKSELAGVALGLIGVTLISLTEQSEDKASIVGDMFAILSAGVYVTYLLISQGISKDHEIPTAHYFFGINAVALLTTVIAFALISSEETFLMFDWVGTPNWPVIIYNGVGPGVVGHFLVTFLLNHVSPLVICVFWGLEAPLGIFIGWCFNYQEVPPLLTMGVQKEKSEYSLLPNHEVD